VKFNGNLMLNYKVLLVFDHHDHNRYRRFYCALCRTRRIRQMIKKKWGKSINTKLDGLIMEIPVVILFFIL